MEIIQYLKSLEGTLSSLRNEESVIRTALYKYYYYYVIVELYISAILQRIAVFCLAFLFCLAV